MNDDKIRNRTYNDCVYNFKNTSYRRFKLKKHFIYEVQVTVKTLHVQGSSLKNKTCSLILNHKLFV